MKKTKIISLLLMALGATAISGCSEGPAEKKGRQADEAIEKVKDKVQNKGPMQKAGENVDEVTGN